MKRLVFIKYLYTQGLTQSKQSPPLSSASVLSFHDAVELFLHLTLEHVGASKKDPHFMEYWDLINDKLDAYAITQKESMKRLTNTRGQLKHHGINPSALDIENLRATTSNFFSENTLPIFDIDFDSISLIDLVLDQVAKDRLHDAQKLLSTNDLPKCMKEVATGFGILIDNYERQKADRFGQSPFFFGEDLTFVTNFSTHLGDKMDEFVDKVGESITSIQDAIKILSFGFDYIKYTKFKRMILDIRRTLDGTYFVSLASDYNFTKEDCIFCIEFVIESALKLQEFDFQTSDDKI